MKNFVRMMTSRILISLVFVGNFIPSPGFGQQNQTPQFIYGTASWYGDAFEGKPTASGEIYSAYGLTAAHKTLPFGTRLEVENLANGKKVEVRVNDRGPFSENRILDLSKQAAEILGFLSEGTTFVKATIIELGTSIPETIRASVPTQGQDVPQNFNPTPAAPVVPPVPTQEITTPIEEDLQASFQPVVKDEFDFMDDGSNDLFAAAEQEVPARAQQIVVPSIEQPILTPPTGFSSNNMNFLVDDPLSNITISEDDEYIAAPLPSPGLQDPNIAILEEEKTDDPFADLFETSNDPLNFQNQVNASSTLPTVGMPAQNIGYDPLPKPVLPQAPQYNIIQQQTPQVEQSLKIEPEIRIEEEEAVFETETPSQPPVVQGSGSEYYVIQLGAFSKQKNAMALYQKLRKYGFNVFITDIKISGKNLIRVRIGYFNNLDEALAVSERLESQYSISNRIIKVDQVD
ncbi:rare lipoprotein A [Brevinema andersonii]|uniref:Probable endolytic peptidoglycan transglycosylase RlpA n=1 Tax=Brevinema andersonii TaxID=34097 RepID=A0A1I1D430_BREAD|nr:septal ring lytic transglycosylase RlpA family protein [Brevinema andersonii]SFB69779.1 rare lipoprotein A [Brevinema andersonii]